MQYALRYKQDMTQPHRHLRFGFRILRDERMGRDGPRFWTLLREPG